MTKGKKPTQAMKGTAWEVLLSIEKDKFNDKKTGNSVLELRARYTDQVDAPLLADLENCLVDPKSEPTEQTLNLAWDTLAKYFVSEMHRLEMETPSLSQFGINQEIKKTMLAKCTKLREGRFDVMYRLLSLRVVEFYKKQT